MKKINRYLWKNNNTFIRLYIYASSKKNITNPGISLRLLARLADQSVAAQSTNIKVNKGLTPLHIYAFNNSLKQAKEFLQINPNPNISDEFGWRPLHDASIQGHTNVVKLLLAAGAHVNVQDIEEKYTPLHDATRLKSC